MKIFLLSAYPPGILEDVVVQHLQESFKLDPYKVHKIVNDPIEADVILFAESHPPQDPYFFKVLTNEVYKKYKNKCYLYHDNDKSLTLLPTISPSIEAGKLNKGFNLPFSYIFQFEINPYLDEFNPAPAKKYLYTFIGASRTYPLRKRLFQLKHERSFLQDTSAHNSWELSQPEKNYYFKTYAEKCLQSKFILCPRGLGPSSYRLYETLKMGIAPVIISDEWLPPEGPNWSEFSIRISEVNINKIPKILEEREPDALKMGQLAKEAWLTWFAQDKHFHFLTEACIKLHNSKSEINFITYLYQFIQFLEPYHFRNLLRYCKNKLKNSQTLIP